MREVILPAENEERERGSEDGADRGVKIHYVKTMEEVVALALPKSTNEQQHDRELREQVIEHATA